MDKGGDADVRAQDRGPFGEASHDHVVALSFLNLIGLELVAEGFHKEIPRGNIYFSMASAGSVEMLNTRLRSKSQKVKLHQAYR